VDDNRSFNARIFAGVTVSSACWMILSAINAFGYVRRESSALQLLRSA
jgi:hypothetical protein